MRMKIAGKEIFFCAIFLITIITACVKSSNTPPLTPTTSTIGQIISRASNLTILDSAMSKSGLLAILDSMNSIAAPFTVFAPVNLAFTNAGFTDSTIYKMSKDSLRNFLGYYIYAGGGLTTSTLPPGPNAPLPTIFGNPVFCTVLGGSIYINGNLVTQNDVIANNGVIQALSGIYYPPAGNIITILQNDTTLSFLYAAVLRANQNSSNFNLDSLLADSLVTFFAPTNAAFRLTPDSTINIINSIVPDSLARLLTTHILRGRVFSSDFTSTDTLYSINGIADSLFVTTTFGLTIQSKGDSTASYLGPVNVIATNGVIHKVSQVLFPYYPF